MKPVTVAQECPTLCDPWTDSPSKNTRVPFPPPGHIPKPGIKPGSPALQADPLPSEPPGKPSKVETQHLKESEGWASLVVQW